MPRCVVRPTGANVWSARACSPASGAFPRSISALVRPHRQAEQIHLEPARVRPDSQALIACESIFIAARYPG
jgi:hypothetical protein